LSEIRNQVAHDSVFFGWRGTERPGPPDVAGMPDRGKDSNKNSTHPGLIALFELEATQNESAARAQRLFALAEGIGVADASPPEAPIPNCRITFVALGERSKDCSLRSLLFDSLASELGRYADTSQSQSADESRNASEPSAVEYGCPLS